MANTVMSTDYDDADIIRTCTRKKGYPSEEIARLSITSIRRTSPDAELRVYGCRHCGRWHIGRAPTSRTFATDNAPPAVVRSLRVRGRREPLKAEGHDRQERLRKERIRHRDDDR